MADWLCVFPFRSWFGADIHLQALVANVDAELLERVGGEDLETENIQNADLMLRAVLNQELVVDATDGPEEERVVDVLYQLECASVSVCE